MSPSRVLRTSKLTTNSVVVGCWFLLDTSIFCMAGGTQGRNNATLRSGQVGDQADFLKGQVCNTLSPGVVIDSQQSVSLVVCRSSLQTGGWNILGGARHKHKHTA